MEKKQNNLILNGSKEEVLDFFKREDVYEYESILLRNLVLKWKEDKEVLIEANRWFGIVDYIDKKLLKERDFALKLVEKNGRTLKYLSKKFKKDEEIVKKAVTQDGLSVMYIDDSLKSNKDIFIIAINKYPDSIGYAHSDVRKDKEIVEKVLSQKIECFRYLSKHIEIDEVLIDKIINEMPDKDARVIDWFDNDFFRQKENVDLLLSKLIDKNYTSMKRLGSDVKEDILRKIAGCNEYKQIIFNNYEDVFKAATIPNILEEIFLIDEKNLMLDLLKSNSKENKDVVKNKKLKF